MALVVAGSSPVAHPSLKKFKARSTRHKSKFKIQISKSNRIENGWIVRLLTHKLAGKIKLQAEISYLICLVRSISQFANIMQREALQRARGVRDFGPEEKIARDKIVETLKTVFEAFGYNPIETPILERYELFASKFGIGQESDAMRETFKLKDQGDRDLVLRTEFTVPFSRFVGMNPQLKKPFKRYQIGQVFRDGPLKLGRYREFYQCDVDVVGVSDPIIDAEILQLTDEVFTKLGLETEIFINNRKILNGILDACGVAKDDQNSVIISIDKLAKLGADGVSKELAGKGIETKQIDFLLEILSVKGTNQELIDALRKTIGDNEGLREIERVLEVLSEQGNLVFSPSLARGLAYYTGNVFEVYLKDKEKINSSICAGGRYDSMIGGFLQSEEEVPAVGISFGLETIFDAISLYGKQEMKKTVVDVLLIPLENNYLVDLFEFDKTLRANSINVDISYLETKLRKALEYADNYSIPWVIIFGEEEKSAGKVTLRNMKTGEQVKVDIEQASQIIKKWKIG